ncbi:MAG TPA: UDP-N-acetylmuramoyl-L-alanine--D-glutamate ligase [Solirubrobacteraceae bacterium]|nr:UDP-N-acetylmuramoyl-L-alanine--D-glutamate ligase [Solirubrobacteraceae bacterium]
MVRHPRPGIPDGPHLVVGLARSGRAAALVLHARGEHVIGVDTGAPEGLDALADAGVELHLAEDGLSLLERVGAVVKSPGVPGQAPVIAAARARGLPVLGELELAWRLLGNEFVAVTGTNGKTTTAELIGHIHRAAGLPVAVAGNVGAALSGLVGETAPNVTIVCETSSFQLEDTLAFAPEAAVLLNIAPDHLDRHATLEDYTAAKLRIFARQSRGDVAVVAADLDVELPDDVSRVTFGLPPIPGRDPRSAAMTLEEGLIDWQGVPLLPATEIALRGRHNVENAMAAAAVCLARGIDPDAVRAGLRTFAGVPHRLEEIARREDVLYVNDSKATNVASTLVALDAFAPGTVHLILGGQSKGQDFTPLREPVERYCQAVYLIGEDAALIASALAGMPVPLLECGELERALEVAVSTARYGDAILLSPGCASFDHFADFEARGERFRELVAQLGTDS